MLTQSELKLHMHYNQYTGIFTRNYVNPQSRLKEGDIAGSMEGEGYLLIMINKKRYKAHRLAFLYINGIFPKEDVDHINHDRGDNRWVNLREASRHENCKNRKLCSLNKSGTVGVFWYKNNNKWGAYISSNNKRIHLGLFEDKQDAIKARQEANLKYDYHPNHGASS